MITLFTKNICFTDLFLQYDSSGIMSFSSKRGPAPDTLSCSPCYGARVAPVN